MLKYVATACALKAASATPQTRSLYRYIGNRFANRDTRYGRGKCAAFLIDKLKDKVSPGDPVLDIGTGWMTFYSVCLAAELGVRPTAYDVVDCRQYKSTKQYFANHPDLPGADVVLQSESFADLHKTLGIDYVLAPSLEALPDNHYAATFSVATFEHIPRSVVRETILDTYRVLRPGGYAVHKIDMSDHLAHYDRSVNKRKFLEWNSSWPLLFNNKLQYVNRLMRSEFLELFTSAGFTIEWQHSNAEPINGMRMNPARNEPAILPIVFRR